ncbi:hypothetical protein BGZ60DRAFT_532931 [Tricladium varicosporioides]|nr:hypothetical protein BGZ60DRAFT_532931 [Hymenoscyphus varicosporioides]
MRQRIEIPLYSAQGPPALVTSPQTTSLNDSQEDTSIQQRITRITADIRDLNTFYNILTSPTRHTRFHLFYVTELTSLNKVDFDLLTQEDKIDYLLLKTFLQKSLNQLKFDDEKDEKTKELLPFKTKVVKLCEDRQKVNSMDAQAAAQELFEVLKMIVVTKEKVEGGEIKIEKIAAFRATRAIEELQIHLDEWYKFYAGYDPLFSWWVPQPYESTQKGLEELDILIKEKLVGIGKNDGDAIVGDPIGREGLRADLESEIIPYEPEELIEIGWKEYAWCEKEMKKASKELGYGDNWKEALECVKNLHVPPGKQPELVRDLSQEAINYVTEHDLVTVPKVAVECSRTYMLSLNRQKANPFFLGGPYMEISYPTNIMDHSWKIQSMRGNNIHFSRSTVFHELIPGHHLQYHYMERYRPYRKLFETPFWIEGWALYWEMILWDKGFPATSENKIGMLFWRMHRCARIIFSINFHLGKMTPQECIDFLTEKVGHERSTAEGEVRRSFRGDYSPLYQAGYMLGALQLHALRNEVVGNWGMGEKKYHDRVLREGPMQIELLRALCKGEEVTRDFKTSWRFYEER